MRRHSEGFYALVDLGWLAIVLLATVFIVNWVWLICFGSVLLVDGYNDATQRLISGILLTVLAILSSACFKLAEESESRVGSIADILNWIYVIVVSILLIPIAFIASLIILILGLIDAIILGYDVNPGAELIEDIAKTFKKRKPIF